jgi:REP element-mobilizing transposase RayT
MANYLNDKSKKLQRKSIRLNEYYYSFPNWYFITICTHERRNLFGKINDGKMILSKAGQVVEEEWKQTKRIRKHVDLDYYTIMPNHLHGIIIIEQALENVGVTRWVAQNKADHIINGRGELNSPYKDNERRMQYAPTKDKFKSPSNTLGAIIRGFKSSVTKRLRELSGNSDLKIWQRNYYEHIIRNEIDLHNIRQYITLNQLKWEIDEYFKSSMKDVKKRRERE